jgi:hypothetical protein
VRLSLSETELAALAAAGVPPQARDEGLLAELVRRGTSPGRSPG